MEIESVLAEVITDVTLVTASSVIGMVGIYVKKWLKSNELVNEYNLYNDKVERVLDNALAYAENKSRDYITPLVEGIPLFL
jgi:hypothetical protein